jgi:3-hydroxyacyl-CoA dehydrogenase
LIDKVVASADLAAVARSLVRDTIATGTQRQPMRLHPFDANSRSQDLALIGRTKNAVDKTRLDARAAVACADAVAAAITEDLQDGVAVEAALFADLVASPQSHELRRRFRAERSAR